MRPRIHAPLGVKTLGWLLLHLLILALTFAGFVRWQLGLGLDSLLSGAAGERLRLFGEAVTDAMESSPPASWNDAIAPLASARGVTAAIFDPLSPSSFPTPIPTNVLTRAHTVLPRAQDAPAGERRGAPPWSRRGNTDAPAGPPEGFGPPDGRGQGAGPGPGGGVGGGLGAGQGPPWANRDAAPPAASPPPNTRPQAPRPAFLVRGDGGDGYWAGVHLILATSGTGPARHHVLLLRADRLDGAGMFFDLKPWLWGGLAVLVLSLAFWTPFLLGITRYLKHLTHAANHIAAGNFHVTLPPRGHDELAHLGHSIQTMAARLDQLITGQKRFLGDAAHELCAPLARLRTSLGILEMKLGPQAANDLAPLETEAAELAALTEEILAFSRARNRAARCETTHLAPLAAAVAAREAPALELTTHIPESLTVHADPSLLARALANLLRNITTHAGPDATATLTAKATLPTVTLTLTDNGPGTDPAELARLFEPFYRPDRSRSRETGGSGLGLAIVRTAIEACGGSVSAFLPPSGGFGIRIELPATAPHADTQNGPVLPPDRIELKSSPGSPGQGGLRAGQPS